jgi:outer membrane protein assembly factor BamE (lipoprotein component of BamABCDE complex)
MNKALILSTALVALVATSGCSRVRGHQGYIADSTLVDAIKPGVDNRESVTKTLGRPTFAGQFDANDWYYVDRETKQLAFALPTPTKQTLLRISFDAAGNVTAVQKTGVEKIASIRPIKDKTPTLGRNRSFFEELFGNIGQVGSVGQGGGTADNPDGGN